jgi:hypothetical protein
MATGVYWTAHADPDSHKSQRQPPVMMYFGNTSFQGWNPNPPPLLFIFGRYASPEMPSPYVWKGGLLGSTAWIILYCSLHIWGNVHALGAQRPMMVISIPKRVLGNWRQKTRFVQFSFCFCWVLLLFSMVSPFCACIAECNAFLQFTHSTRN